MSLTHLLHALEAEAQREIADLARATRAEVDAILAEARQRASALERDLLDRHEAQARTETARILAVARLDAAAMLRDARDEQLAALHGQVRHALTSVDARALIPTLLEEAIAQLPDFTAVHVAPGDEHVARRAVEQRRADAVEIVADLDRRGVVVVDERTRRHVDNTLETRLDNLWPDLRPHLAAGWVAVEERPA